MSRVYNLYETSENLLQENSKEIVDTEANVRYLKSDKATAEKELTEAKKQVELLSNDLKEIRENLNKETAKIKLLSKEEKILSNTAKMLKPKPVEEK